MKLIDLQITINGEVKRLVEFHAGLNLITNRPNSGRTGNSVGKSTLSRVVDFLMLGSISGIYIDEEFKKPNQDIETLFLNNHAIASLTFFDGTQVHEIARSLTIGDKEDEEYYIDGKRVGTKDYEIFIQASMFDIRTRRPTVRSIAPKFIRNNSHRMLSTTKFLDKNSTGKDYSELFLYLFGFSDTELLTEKRDATNLVKRRKRNSQSLNAMVKEQKPLDEIKKYRLDAKDLEENLLTFDYAPEYTNPIERLTNLQSQEDRFTHALLSTERKIENIERTIKLLAQDGDEHLINEVKAIYDYSGIALDRAILDLEKVISFHKNLIKKKEHFLIQDLPSLREEKEELIVEINSIRKDKAKVFTNLRSKESLDNVTNNLKRLGELRVELGKLEGLIEQQSKAKLDLQSAEDDLEAILKSILREMDNVYNFEKIFNKHLKVITKLLHDDEYEINFHFNQDSGICDIEMKNSVTNPEGGKKKAEVISFDFAYICTLNELMIRRPTFIFHDGIEDIDKKQIKVIFQLSKSLPGQQILSMLSDKIDEETYAQVSKNIVLLLDEDEKFFNV